MSSVFADFSRLVFEWRTNPARERSISRDAFGRKVGLSGDTVRRWETGKQRPSPANCEEVARVLGVPASTVLNAAGYTSPGQAVEPPRETPDALWPQDSGDGVLLPALADLENEVLAVVTVERHTSLVEEAMDRREVMLAAGYAATASALRWTLDPEPLVSRAMGGRIGADTIADIARSIEIKNRQANMHAGPAVMRSIRAELEYVVSLLKTGSYTEPTGRQLYAAAAKLSEMLGWLFYESNNYPQAMRYYSVGLRAAHSSGDRGLGACLLNSMAVVARHLGNPSQAADFLRLADKGSNGVLTPRLTALLRGELARAHGQARNVSALERAADEAANAMTGAQPDDDDPTYASWYDKAALDGTLGSAFLDAGDARSAQTYLERATALPDPTHPRDEAKHLVYLAQAHLRQGEVDAASIIGMRSLDLTERLRTGRLLTVTQAFAGELGQVGKSHPGAVAVLDRVRALPAATPSGVV